MNDDLEREVSVANNKVGSYWASTTAERNRQILVAVGEAIHGRQWRRPLAEDLGYSERHIMRLVDGSTPIQDVLQDGTPLLKKFSELLLQKRQKVDAALSLVIQAMTETQQ